MSNVEQLADRLKAEHDATPGYVPASRTPFVVTIEKGKLELPALPDPGDPARVCEWLTCALNLNPENPVTGAEHEGLRGPDGHIVIRRAGDAPPIRFEPASKINNPTKLIETLTWRKLPTDNPVHAYKAEHSRLIAHVVGVLCGTYEAMTEEQEADAIVGDHLQRSVAVTGRTTYGTGAQSYEAAVALRRETDPGTGRWFGPPRYLIDSEGSELVIGVSDLSETARRHVGSSLPRGWLDARMQALGWTRIRLDGHELPGAAGRTGPHARIDAYRGHRPGDDHAVTT